MTYLCYQLALLVTIVTIGSTLCKSSRFCDSDKPAVTSIFSHHKTIYLIRDNSEFWLYKEDNQAGPQQLNTPPLLLSITFPVNELNMGTIATAFTVDSVPEACDESKLQTHREWCIFNAYMLNTTFIFYQRNDNKDRQVYSMIRPKSKSSTFFLFNSTIGGYGYELRANRSTDRSSFPGVSPEYISNDRVNKFVGTVYDSRNRAVIMIGINNANQYVAYKKLLDTEWDEKITKTDLGSVDNSNPIISAFKYNDAYHVMYGDHKVYQLNDDLTLKKEKFSSVHTMFCK
ncbi:uncharacterized protein LOC128957971 [Oppia nitens]|uniref:uncharacterized protein LOC128957971 n=1 Tax=Oppia nitens TaxID=1686743 RepID=UPI0023DB4E6E|nr:uncharacterized protein LOC128957971 [Oppia nitens]